MAGTSISLRHAPDVLMIISPAADDAGLLPFALLTLPVTPHQGFRIPAGSGYFREPGEIDPGAALGFY